MSPWNSGSIYSDTNGSIWGDIVSRAMGHKNVSTTQRYAKITHEKIDRDVDIFRDNISGKFALSGIDSAPSTILKDMSRRKYRPSKRLLTSNGE